MVKSIGPDGLPMRIRRYELSELSSARANRALQIIGKYRRDDVLVVCGGAAVFYEWVGIVSSVLSFLVCLVLLCSGLSFYQIERVKRAGL